ncbi:hypothetical protein BJ742DRAFT_822087 [Cladochytrium replicatum]|nr:hypothetical protein BJ742DRAFT_822087 [Cladochytrium replicatum]
MEHQVTVIYVTILAMEFLVLPGMSHPEKSFLLLLQVMSTKCTVYLLTRLIPMIMNAVRSKNTIIRPVAM